MAEPLKLHYDLETDTLRVNDTLFAGDLFRQLDSLLPKRMPFVIDERVVREDGTKAIILEALTKAELQAAKLDEKTEIAKEKLNETIETLGKLNRSKNDGNN